MKFNQKAVIVFGILIVLVAFFLADVFVRQEDLSFLETKFKKLDLAEDGTEKIDDNFLKIGEKEIKITVADDPNERQKGLGDREELEKDEGMFFVFETDGSYGFWMKDMLFPIDIIWLDSNMEIVYIENNVDPGSFPQVFRPSKQSRFVLEVNAGFAKENNIKVGDTAVLL